MKKYTHPILFYTVIRQKDASSYGKYWGYLRPNLTIEVDAFSSTNVVQTYKVFSLKKGDETIPTNQKPINLNFWVNS